MSNCRNCGVELDVHMNFCPLCGTPVFHEAIHPNEQPFLKQQAGTRKLRDEIDLLNRTQRRKLFWEVVSIILAAAIVSTLVLNLLINRAFTWSAYVLTGGITIFLYVTLFSFVKRNFWTLSFLTFVISFLSMLALDQIISNDGWPVRLGLPLLFAAFIIIAVIVAAIKHVPEKGFNLIAYIFLALAALSLAVEGIVSLYINNQFHLTWSIIVFFSVLPTAIILLYIHYKLRKGTDLRKFFHI